MRRNQLPEDRTFIADLESSSDDETESLLSTNEETAYNHTTYNGQYGFYNLLRAFSHLLQMGGEAAINVLMTFLTWFPKLVPQFAFIFIFPIFTVSAQYLYNIGKILLNPLMNWKHKTFFLAAITTATTLILAPLVSNFFLEFLKISFVGFKAIAGVAPFLFTAALAVHTSLLAYGAIMKAWDLIANSYKRTSLAKLSLANKIVKTLSLATITSLIIPLFLTLGAITLFSNPFTAGPAAAIMFSIIMAASATLITMKIIKTIAKHRLQERMAYEALEGGKDHEAFNPYELLQITQKEINTELTKTRRFLGEDRVIGFLNKRDLKVLLNDRYKDAKAAIEAEKLNPDERTARLYKLQLAYEMLGHPRGREMFDAFKAVKDSKDSDRPLEPLQARQKQFGVGYKFQKIIPVSWLMRPIAAIIYQVKKSKLGNNEAAKEHLALSYRLATNAALSDYYQEISARSSREVTASEKNPFFSPHEDQGPSSPRPTHGARYTPPSSQSGTPSSSQSSPSWKTDYVASSPRPIQRTRHTPPSPQSGTPSSVSSAPSAIQPSSWRTAVVDVPDEGASPRQNDVTYYGSPYQASGLTLLSRSLPSTNRDRGQNDTLTTAYGSGSPSSLRKGK